jgi:hypothetical protein
VTDVESAKLPGRTNYSAIMADLALRQDIAGVISRKLDRLLRNLKDYTDVERWKGESAAEEAVVCVSRPSSVRRVRPGDYR